MTLIESFLLALIEGLTEFLPVSSTAHILFTAEILGVKQDAYVKMFAVSIQFGAILAVVVAYWRKFFDFKNLNFYKILALAVLPALVLGKLFDDAIEGVFEKPLIIAIVLILGGIVLLFVDKWFQKPSPTEDQPIGIKKGFIIGLWQCIAMMPGVSRSAASIIGGLQQGLNRKSAAEFSFFLAVPTMAAATLYSLIIKSWEYQGQSMKGYEMIFNSNQNSIAFLVGNVVSFGVAFLAIRGFIAFLQKYGFRIWGIYRIVVGVILLLFFINQNPKQNRASMTERHEVPTAQRP